MLSICNAVDDTTDRELTQKSDVIFLYYFIDHCSIESSKSKSGRHRMLDRLGRILILYLTRLNLVISVIKGQSK